MTQPVISVENLCKAYRIGIRETIPDTLLGTMAGWLRAPLGNLRRLRRLDTFGLSPVAGKSDPRHDESDLVWALRDVSFDVREGEVVGIIGRNGAGKSTLLKILSRITEPTSGGGVIRGRVSSLLEVGTGFHPELTGRENIYMNGTILGMTKREIDRKFDEIVAFSGVERFLDTAIKRYSSGMQVRLAFAVAAHLEPEVLIVDEVLAVGDAEFQKKCLGKMKDVARGGRTVLFVSHQMAAVEGLCERVILMDGGTIACDATPHVSTQKYLEQLRRSAGPSAHTSCEHRRDSQDALIRYAAIVDRAGRRTNYVRLGRPFRFRVILEPVAPIRDAVIGIGIDDLFGRRMLSLNSSGSAALPENLTSSLCIEGCIRRFPLAPGEYALKVVVHSGRRIHDSVEDVLRFTVVDSSLDNAPAGFHSGVCIAECEWSEAPRMADCVYDVLLD